ncbi:nuclear transport factor 2 family protein (plasmid) [Spirosoma sp. KNUC1025]|nr:nuclear transport factor 2 family protein [Spirosoma sp. KNUC1025]
MEDALAMLSPDVIYHNFPVPDLIGQEAVRKHQYDAGIGTTLQANWEIVHLAAVGNVVLNERIDNFMHANGTILTVPVMGTLTIEEGAITVWRDYFDSASAAQQYEQLMHSLA